MKRQTIPIHWRRYSFYAMGCQMTVWLEMENRETAARLLRKAEAEFRAAETVLSRFDDTSELSCLNGRAGRWTPVSDLLWTVISRAIFMADETGGLFDPTLLDALEAAGYDRTFSEITPQQTLRGGAKTNNRRSHWQEILFDAATQAIWLPPGIRLDLGGIAKGHTAQRVVDLLNEEGACLVDAGGDLTAGAAPLDLPGWPVSVAAPFHETTAPETDLLQLWLVNGSMATSGIDCRRWQRNGHLAHHLIDPRTGQPAHTDLLTTTVLASAAARAEAWATAAVVGGSTLALQMLSQISLAAALFDQQSNLLLTPALASFLNAGALEVSQTVNYESNYQ